MDGLSLKRKSIKFAFSLLDRVGRNDGDDDCNILHLWWIATHLLHVCRILDPGEVVAQMKI